MNMRNVTVTLEEDLARWARIKAAGEMISLSRYLGRLLEQARNSEKGSMVEPPEKRFFDALPARNLGVTSFDRDALYDRQILR